MRSVFLFFAMARSALAFPFALDGYIVHLTLSIFCSFKRTSSALLYILLQLRQNLASLYTDRNVLVDLQRGQIINLGLFNVINIVLTYRYNGFRA